MQNAYSLNLNPIHDLGAVTGANAVVANAAQPVHAVIGGAQTIAGGLSTAASLPVKTLGWITDPGWWLRIGMVVLGLVFLVMGVSKLFGSGSAVFAPPDTSNDETETQADEAQTETTQQQTKAVQKSAKSKGSPAVGGGKGGVTGTIESTGEAAAVA